MDCFTYFHQQKHQSAILDFDNTIAEEGFFIEENNNNDKIDLMSFDNYIKPNDFVSDCGICRNELLEYQGLLLIKCNHTFHKNCISEYIANNISENVVCPSATYDGNECLRGLMVSFILYVIVYI